MARFMPSLKTATRAALAALVIGGGAVAALPSQAAGFGFNFTPGNGGSVYFYGGNSGQYNNHYRPRPQVCLTDHQVRRQLRDEGFSDIRLFNTAGTFLKARAEKGRWTYTLRINRCTGNVAVLERDRTRRGGTFNLYN